MPFPLMPVVIFRFIKWGCVVKRDFFKTEQTGRKMWGDGDHGNRPPPPLKASLSLQRVVNEKIVWDSVQINSASLIFISHVTPRTCLQTDWGHNQREALMQRGGWELLASRHLMFVTAVLSANISHLFTFGSLKIETFPASVLEDCSLPTALLQPS